MGKGTIKTSAKSDENVVVIDQSHTSITDTVQIAKRKDNSVLLRLLSVTPDYLVENHRTVICKDEIITLIDGLCDILKYYPKKPKTPKTPRRPIKKKNKN